MSVRSLSIVLLALIFGGSLAFGINNFIKKGQAAAPAETVTVIIAKEDIDPFATLTADMVKEQQVPKDSYVQPGSFDLIDEVVGRVSLFSLPKGEILTVGRLTPKGGAAGIVAVIPKGMRAFTIQVPNIASSVAGFTQAGSKVDVLLSVKHRGGTDATGGSATTLLQDIKVLAVDQRVEQTTAGKVDPKEVRSITLLVTPDQADTLARNTGDVQLSLRHPDDTADAKQPATKDKANETVPIVVAAEDIAQFSTLTPGLLKIQHLPKDAWIPPGTFESIEKVVGRVNSSAIVKGEPLSTTRLAAKGSGQPLGLEIPLGMRAFTIQMPNVASSVAGFTRAGSKVDVLVTMKNKGVNDTKGPMSTTLLEGIKVLAVDQHVEEPTAGKLDPKEVRSITLLVNPEQADKLAQHSGDLQLSLRNPEDNSVKAKQTTAPATSSVRNPPALIQTIRGNQTGFLELR